MAAMNSGFLSYLTALGGGIISFISPCVLPLVPAYISFVTGESLEELTDGTDKRRIVRHVTLMAVIFVLGFSTIFVTLGASATAINKFLIQNQELFGRVAGVIVMLLGLHFLGLFRFGLLHREARFHMADRPAGLFGVYVIGLAFGFGWTPCIGPILGAILTIAATRDDLFYGISLLSVYSLGLGIPFILAAMSMKWFLRFSQRIRPHMRKIEIIAGLLLIVTGILIFTATLGVVANWMLRAFPWLQNVG